MEGSTGELYIGSDGELYIKYINHPSMQRQHQQKQGVKIKLDYSCIGVSSGIHE